MHQGVCCFVGRIRRLVVLPCVAVLLGLAAVRRALADVVELTDGSTLVGTLVTVSGETLTLETGFAGTLEVPFDQVARLQTDAPRVAVIAGGDRVVGTLDVERGDQIVRHSTLGPVPVPVGDIEAIYDPSAMSPDEIDSAEAVRQNPDLEVGGPEWSGRFSLGLSGETGNTEEFDLTARLNMQRETRDDRLYLYALYAYEETESVKSTNEFIAGVRLEHDLSDRVFLYGAAEGEYDEFENIDLRLTLTGGLGYFFIREDKQEFKGIIGAGYKYEDFNDGTDSRDEPIFELGYDYRIDLSDRLRFTHAVRWTPTFEDPSGDYRLTSDANVEILITSKEDWKILAGLRTEYDSRPAETSEELENTYYFNLGYSW